MANRTGAILKRFTAFGLLIAVLLSGGCAPPQETEIPSTRPLETEPYEFMPVDPALLAYTEDYTPVDRTLQIPVEWTEEAAVTELCLENDNIQIRLDLSQGIILTAITDKRLDHSYLTEPTDLFSYRVRTNLEVGGFEASSWFGSSESILVTAVRRSPDGNAVALEARSRSLPMEFTLVLTLRESAVDLQIQLKTAFGGDTLVNIKCPDISEVGLPCEPENARACIPQEIGWTGKYDDVSTYGAADVATSGLLEVPTALNGIDLAVIYANDNTGGIYFADLEGEISQRIPRVQMSIVNKRITGDWVYTASAGETVVMPKVQIGTFVDGDWHKAVDAVLEASPDRVALADDIPAWIRECGGVYATRGIGSGACYMVTDFADSSQRYLTDYRQMPKLLERAREFGTDVIMLCDYQMAAKATPEWSEITQDVDLSAYSSSRYLVNQENKGDYPYIREDWGGSEAFKEGIAAVHQQGGKVIVYMESFIVYQLSMLSQKVKQIAAILPDGRLDATYDDFYSMVASNETWQDTLTELAVTMVQEYDVDGIFFDSYGCHFNQLFAAAEDQKFTAIQEYNAQMVVLMERIRTAIRRIKPDAVVLAETGSGECLSVTDGGWTADFAWFNLNSAGVILESPLKYAQPQSNLYSNGGTMNELHQVFAAGYGLCLCDYSPWEQNMEEIRTLVELRKTYMDAFVYGTVPFAPEVSEDGVGSSYFKGAENEIVTVVNTKEDMTEVNVGLGAEFSGVSFEDLLTGEIYTADAGGNLSLSLEAEGLAVLLRQ
ncbi:MAG: DUF6259 domain-containing protein [Faecousia sp.]